MSLSGARSFCRFLPSLSFQNTARIGITAARQQIWTRSFTSSTAAAIKQMPPRPTVSEADIEEAFLKGSGPGGQKINKTASAVQLKHLPTGIVVKSQNTRSRTQNRKHARLLLAEKLEEMQKGPESRRAVKADVARKRKASKTKKAKRKYKQLGEDATTEKNDAEEGEYEFEESDAVDVVDAPESESGQGALSSEEAGKKNNDEKRK
ncbi:hypothetical protein L228DRAFT_284389 [Xylona heveae TC161]|uniref:Prokaryotic-type class I peptide chain release factors domain-containing protein n=1 Tax=Xylona heveae (strain CBS 132557 / TC161) TaxID=1328760 RepID=A0A165FT43_XYLHT|nr:hypothetical protein L228DRAFT_284389 [Xylona heveae TC161]KZF21341.1 hypothetical protein L228DRAFT_284389 [Xylona heveae TC161]